MGIGFQSNSNFKKKEMIRIEQNVEELIVSAN